MGAAKWIGGRPYRQFVPPPRRPHATRRPSGTGWRRGAGKAPAGRNPSWHPVQGSTGST